MRPHDLAREHGISTQAVRNYEQDGFLPPADRTASGYRVYTEAHAAALRAFLALIPAYGHATAGQLMNAVNRGEIDQVLKIIDRGHAQLLRDRETLAAVRTAVDHLTAETAPAESADPEPRTVGELAHQLQVTPATLRNWEDAGILTPARDPMTGYRIFHASDVRDAELAHLLRRGGYPLDRISTVVHQIRTAGGTDTLARALADWQRKLTERGLAMLHSATRLSQCLDL
ncbi:MULTISPECIES: TioE family transcriptional regulator [unclassified Crossiella]|uniref:TioE family transcriptional regulator n=1 Tax=unclassified Crossiella TaxID=2620835 RepID=UPI001FFF8B8D|nr:MULTISPECIES: TioE family transcriptional regulator [unclassified Crossiella]MCK2241714.1 TioE family transcriptional regulator [Crossiella sp. S99.2]MCK2255414.1 TioE family transcriptional regulator [Crossiella sp. S99.1]